MLAKGAESPDTDVHNGEEFVMSDTWSFEEFQDKYHSLNGGFHSEEEFKTAIAILNESSDAKIGSLLHRYKK